MKKRSHVISIFLLAVFISCAVVQFLAGADIRALMFDSDALNVPTVVDNLIAHGGSLAHWYLSPAPYLFPDAVMHAVIHPLTSGMYARLAAFAAVQIAVLFALLWWLAARTNRNRPLAIAVAVTGNLTWMAILRGGPYNQLMTAGFHYGAFLVSIAVVVLAMSVSKRSNWVALGVLCFLTSLSDNIIVIQTTIPLVGTLLLISLFDAEHRSHRLITAVITAVSSVGGSRSYGLFITHNTRYPLHLNSEKFHENYSSARLIAEEFLRHHEPIAAGVVFTAVLAGFYGVRLMKRVRRIQPIAFVTLFAFASVVCTFAGLVLATTNEMSIRYFIPIFSWPVIIGGLVIFNTEIFRGVLPTFVATMSAIILCLNTSTFVDTHGIDRTYHPDDIACIDSALPTRAHLHGMANYWDAKYIQAFSKHDVVVAQYMADVTPMKWITTDDYFAESYDFVVISTAAAPQFIISQSLILQKYGNPISTTTCGTRIVLNYARGE